MVELEEQLTIFDYSGHDIGQLAVALFPCTKSGREIIGEYVENPSKLVSKFLFTVILAELTSLIFFFFLKCVAFIIHFKTILFVYTIFGRSIDVLDFYGLITVSKLANFFYSINKVPKKYLFLNLYKFINSSSIEEILDFQYP